MPRPTKQDYLMTLGARRRAGHSESEIAAEILAARADRERIRLYFHYYPEASFDAFWLQWGNMLRCTREQANKTL